MDIPASLHYITLPLPLDPHIGGSGGR